MSSRPLSKQQIRPLRGPVFLLGWFVFDLERLKQWCLYDEICYLFLHKTWLLINGKKEQKECICVGYEMVVLWHVLYYNLFLSIVFLLMFSYEEGSTQLVMCSFRANEWARGVQERDAAGEGDEAPVRVLQPVQLGVKPDVLAKSFIITGLPERVMVPNTPYSVLKRVAVRAFFIATSVGACRVRGPAGH